MHSDKQCLHSVSAVNFPGHSLLAVLSGVLTIYYLNATLDFIYQRAQVDMSYWFIWWRDWVTFSRLNIFPFGVASATFSYKTQHQITHKITLTNNIPVSKLVQCNYFIYQLPQTANVTQSYYEVSLLRNHEFVATSNKHTKFTEVNYKIQTKFVQSHTPQ